MSGKKSQSTWPIFKQLLSFFKPYSLWVIVRVTSTILKALIDIATIIFVQRIVDSALAGNRQELVKTIFIMLVFISVDILMYFSETYSSGRFSSYAVRDIKEKLICHIGKLPVSYMEAHHSGDLVSRANNDVNALEGFLRGGFLDLVFHFLRVVICLVYLIFLNWQLLLACAVIIIIATVLSNKISNPVRNYAEQLQENLAKVNSVAQDSFGGMHMLKAFNLVKVLYDKYKAAVVQTLKVSLSIEKRNAMVATMSLIINLVPGFLCILCGGFLVITGRFTVGGLVIFIQFLGYMSEGAKHIPEYINQYKQNMGIAGHLFEVFNEKVERIDGEKYEINAAVPAVEFNDVSFAYSEEIKVLDHLSFKLQHGKVTALVGPSGGGKTTVLKLLCGFYELLDGSIKLYGEDFGKWNISSARSKISLVSQDIYLFPGTVAENIAYGHPGVSFDEIVGASKASNSHDYIMKLPEGYNTMVGERGAKLSGGQRQRISIARAILKNAPILLLDEPTSALDTESEILVQEALESFIKGRTVLVVAHRLSTIKNADMVLVMDQGKIAESGFHDELLKEGGIYKQLYFKQFFSSNVSLKAVDGEGA